MHYNWSNELEEIKGDTSRFASPFESLNFFRRSVHRVSSNRCLVDGVPRENAIGIHPPRVLLHGGRDGNAKTPRSTSRRTIRRCSKFFETTLSTILETISFFFHEEEKEFDRLERFSANILLPYPLDINIVYIISSLISSNVICLWFAHQLESFSTDVKSSKIQDSSLESLKANTRVQSLINLFALTRRISNAMQISQVFKLRSFEFFLKKQNLDRFASLIGQYVNKKRSTKHDIRKTSRKQIGRCL